jgi:hypothetical protein
MLNITVLLLLAALIVTIASAVGRAPLWVAVLLVVIALLLRALPL